MPRTTMARSLTRGRCNPRRCFRHRRCAPCCTTCPPACCDSRGFVRTDEHGWAEVQFAGRHGSLRKAVGKPGSGAALVAIGLRGRLPMEALDAAFSAWPEAV